MVARSSFDLTSWERCFALILSQTAFITSLSDATKSGKLTLTNWHVPVTTDPVFDLIRTQILRQPTGRIVLYLFWLPS